MEILNAREADLEDCETVLRAAFGGYVRQLNRIQSSDAYSWLAESIAAQQVLTAREGTHILGVAIFSDQGRKRTIEQIAVAPDSQGRGIGRALIHRIEQNTIKANMASLELDTAEKMIHLVDLYRNCGFEIVSSGPPKHGRDNYTRVFMRKLIQTD